MAELNGVPATTEELAALALTNYGHFTSMRVDDGRVRGLSLHMERLARDCRVVFGTDLNTDLVLEYARKAAAQQQVTSFTIRITIFDPHLGLGNIGAAAEPHVLVTVRPAGHLPPASPLTAKSFTYSRDDAAVKHVGLFGQLKCRRDAIAAGFDDALFLELDGQVSEGATWNVGFVTHDGEVVWPAAPVLPGVTMHLLQRLFPANVREVRGVELGELAGAFATNTSIGVRPIRRIDDVTFDIAHAVIARMQAAYAELAGELL
ncbi:MAG TPA: aminotransferase class IV family protein [Propionibacteriaceae bacterium]|nr:aminotransferase class IV family protein [Propionibacteriaceae bacterium]